MMSQLKQKYNHMKGMDPRDFSRLLSISSEDLMMAETWQQAQVFENNRLIQKAVKALVDYKNRQLMKYTYHN
jgi:hypothetical protein